MTPVFTPRVPGFGLLKKSALLFRYQAAHVVHRRQDQVGAFEPSGQVEAVQRIGIERLQPFAVDAMQAGQVRSQLVIEAHVQRYRLDQFEGMDAERRFASVPSRRRMPLRTVEICFQVRRVAALRQNAKEADPRRTSLADAPRYMFTGSRRSSPSTCCSWKPIRKGPRATWPGRYVASPAIALQEQVLVCRKAEQRHGLVLAAFGIPAEENWVFALQLGKLGRICGHHSDGVAEAAAEAVSTRKSLWATLFNNSCRAIGSPAPIPA